MGVGCCCGRGAAALLWRLDLHPSRLHVPHLSLLVPTRPTSPTLPLLPLCPIPRTPIRRHKEFLRHIKREYARLVALLQAYALIRWMAWGVFWWPAAGVVVGGQVRSAEVGSGRYMRYSSASFSHRPALPPCLAPAPRGAPAVPVCASSAQTRWAMQPAPPWSTLRPPLRSGGPLWGTPWLVGGWRWATSSGLGGRGCRPFP